MDKLAEAQRRAFTVLKKQWDETRAAREAARIEEEEYRRLHADEIVAQEAERLAWIREEARKANIRRSRIPKRFSNADVADCPPNVWEYAEGFQPDTSSGLVIVGEPGRGKTHAACAVLNHLADRVAILFATTGDMLRDIQSTFDGEGSEFLVVKKYSTVPVLVVDDIGKEKPSEWALKTLYDIIDARYRNCLPTIFTTQYDKSQLAARLASGGNRPSAEAIVSRIWSNKEVRLSGTDRRASASL